MGMASTCFIRASSFPPTQITTINNNNNIPPDPQSRNNLKPSSSHVSFPPKLNKTPTFDNGRSGRGRRGHRAQSEYEEDEEERERRMKEEVNRKIASKKAISIILRREATKAVIEKKRGPTNSKKLLPRTVLEALHERIAAFRWESALKDEVLYEVDANPENWMVAGRKRGHALLASEAGSRTSIAISCMPLVSGYMHPPQLKLPDVNDANIRCNPPGPHLVCVLPPTLCSSFCTPA